MADFDEIKIHDFSERILEHVVHFHVMKMRDSVFIWAGENLELNSLSVAMSTKYDSIPAVTNVLGDVSNVNSDALAQKFATKLNKQCFMSYNIPFNEDILPLVEKRILKEINVNPNYF